MFQFSGFATLSLTVFNCVGCPIRTSTDQRSFAPPRCFSQLTTSFVASESQGIPHAPFVRFHLFDKLTIPNLVSPTRLVFADSTILFFLNRLTLVTLLGSSYFVLSAHLLSLQLLPALSMNFLQPLCQQRSNSDQANDSKPICHRS